MKRLLFLLLFIFNNSLIFCANLYFDYPSNGDTYYFNSQGFGGFACHLRRPSNYFLIVDGYGCRINPPDGDWGPWEPWGVSQSGSYSFTKAGTYLIQGYAHVEWDYAGNHDYFIYTNSLTIYLVDNYAPGPPQNLATGLNPGDNHVRLTWSSNTEQDMDFYEISRKVNESGWGVVTTTTSLYWVDPNWAYNSSPFDVSYRIRARDVNNHYSGYSNIVTCHPYPMSKKSADLVSTDISRDYKPRDYKLSNYPNPFNPTTTITYQIKEKGFISIKIYDMLGKTVSDLVNEIQDAGYYSVIFDASTLPSGVYICSFRVNNFIKNQKMIFTK